MVSVFLGSCLECGQTSTVHSLFVVHMFTCLLHLSGCLEKPKLNLAWKSSLLQLGNISVIERNAYGMQKSARPSPPLSAVSNKTATARTGE